MLSFHQMNQYLLSKYEEKQIYRIDHLLGKDRIENLTVLRFSNLIFEPLWSRTYIRNVQVTDIQFHTMVEVILIIVCDHSVIYVWIGKNVDPKNRMQALNIAKIDENPFERNISIVIKINSFRTSKGVSIHLRAVEAWRIKEEKVQEV